MRLPTITVYILLSVPLSLAQILIEDKSFGSGATISPNSFTIPGWQILGDEGHVPQLLSDKVIVTPPYGANKRGALWTEDKNSRAEWEFEVQFRAGGQDRGGGHLQFWYTNDGPRAVSVSSIYSVGRFDGLALVIDTHAGRQAIRGFLNDGRVDYKTHSNIDSLAFGHCDYRYRNLGRPSTLKAKLTDAGGLEVLIDNSLCFRTDKITLPTDYYFGITAASTDPPDSFEVFKFLLRTASSPARAQAQVQAPPQGQNPVSQPDSTPQPVAASGGSGTNPADLAQMLTRLDALTTAINSLTAASEARHRELMTQLSATSSQRGSGVSSIESRLAKLEDLLRSLKHDLDYRGSAQSSQISSLHSSVSEMGVHIPNRMREYVQDHAPRVGFMIGCFMAFQGILVVSYVLYKRRRLTAPKKYL